MITAKEAKKKVRDFYKCDEKIEYYKTLIDKIIRDAANEGKDSCLVTIDIMCSDIMCGILMDNGFDLRIAKTNGMCYTWISW